MRRKGGRQQKVTLSVLACAAFILIALSTLLGAYTLWKPGAQVTDGRHDLEANGMWLQHGWLGDDEWFSRTRKDPRLFRDSSRIGQLKLLLTEHHILYVFPHLCPCTPEGPIPALDGPQARRFLQEMKGLQVMPWVGGILGKQVFLGSPEWRKAFVTSVASLLYDYPAFAGVHVNIEPVPTGSADFLRLLQELRQAMPEGAALSVAAFPPPTIFHPFPRVHWQKEYFESVAQEVDQMVVMMYDTGLRLQKPYVHLMASWTKEVLAWAGVTDVLLGLPVYEDKGARNHFSRVENLPNALSGVHRGLLGPGAPPQGYRGIALYSEWEMDSAEWAYLKTNFLRVGRGPGS
jgi:hypothetical protein